MIFFSWRIMEIERKFFSTGSVPENFQDLSKPLKSSKIVALASLLKMRRFRTKVMDACLTQKKPPRWGWLSL